MLTIINQFKIKIDIKIRIKVVDMDIKRNYGYSL